MSTREEIVAAHSVVMAFLAANNVKEMLVGADVGRRALDAAARFGQVVGHPANLNLGTSTTVAPNRVRHRTWAG